MAASRALAASASLAARIFSISRCWLICASSSCLVRTSRCLVASSWVCRTEISASASISARFLRLTAMISASLRNPTALNALFSSKDENADWSSRVNDTEFSTVVLLEDSPAANRRCR